MLITRLASTQCVWLSQREGVCYYWNVHLHVYVIETHHSNVCLLNLPVPHRTIQHWKNIERFDSRYEKHEIPQHIRRWFNLHYWWWALKSHNSGWIHQIFYKEQQIIAGLDWFCGEAHVVNVGQRSPYIHEKFKKKHTDTVGSSTPSPLPPKALYWGCWLINVPTCCWRWGWSMTLLHDKTNLSEKKASAWPLTYSEEE